MINYLHLNLIHFVIISLLIASETRGQGASIPRSSPNAVITQRIGVTDITVNYCRPSVRERNIFGDLVPYDKVWRAGANEATTISFNYPVKFEKNEVPAGKYGFFVIPGRDSWTLILNSEWDQWGAYNYNEKKDVLRVKVRKKDIEITEMCTFSFMEIKNTSGILALDWENTRIIIHLETETHQNTLSEIDKAVASSGAYWYSYSAAAQYHYYERKEADKALEYLDVAIALKAPNPAPWMLKSQILASQEKYKKAIEMAEDAIEVSKKYNFWFEIHENEENIKKWRAK